MNGPLPMTSPGPALRGSTGATLEQSARVLIAVLLIGGGVAALIVRARADRLHWWPLLLVAIGVMRVGTSGPGEREEGWWLIAAGWSLLVASVTPAVAPLAIVATGVAAFLRTMRTTGQPKESAHVN